MDKRASSFKYRAVRARLVGGAITGPSLARLYTAASGEILGEAEEVLLSEKLGISDMTEQQFQLLTVPTEESTAALHRLLTRQDGTHASGLSEFLRAKLKIAAGERDVAELLAYAGLGVNEALGIKELGKLMTC